MKVYVFTGPTISAEEASRILSAVYLPPAVEGDVHRVALQHPKVIGIIDGYFQSTPAVRHKEILWAMSQGIHVFGAASMGALRAAELAAFGMEGVGHIFESYRNGILEDDDEVAIVHGPAESGFRPGSEAMVNIRQTLRKAEELGIISKELHATLLKIGKEFFYADRSYTLILRRALECGIPQTQLSGLRKWLRHGRVDQKREDAISMLRLIRRRLAKVFKPKRVSYCFQHTAMWESVWRQSGAVRFGSNPKPDLVANELLLDELRLEGDQYKRHCLAALERFLVIRESESPALDVSNGRRRRTELTFRRERALIDEFKFDRWLKQNGLNHDEFDVLMTEEMRRNWYYRRNQLISISCLPDQLRLSGDYPRLIARAEAKSRLLQSLGLENVSLKTAQLTENQLLHWYFDEILRREVPDNLRTYATDLGLPSAEAFRRLLLKEYLYRRFKADPPIASRRMPPAKQRVL